MSSKQATNQPSNVDQTNNSITDYGLLNHSLGYLLRRAQVKAFQNFASHFDAFDIKPAQFSALELIDKNPGMRQSRLAEALGLQRTNLVGMLDLLQKRELIKRQPAPDDRRSHALHLTPKGSRLLEQLHTQFHNHENELFQSIGDEGNLQAVRRALLAISHLSVDR
jgi:DNA-binding MarR family transcriptional regulator